jgi:hypothetical protein
MKYGIDEKNCIFRTHAPGESLDLADEGHMIDFYNSGFMITERIGKHRIFIEKHYPVQRL